MIIIAKANFNTFLLLSHDDFLIFCQKNSYFFKLKFEIKTNVNYGIMEKHLVQFSFSPSSKTISEFLSLETAIYNRSTI